MIETIREHLFRRHFQKLNLPPRDDQAFSTNRLKSITILAGSPYHTVEALEKANNFFDRHGIISQGYFIDTSANPPSPTRSVDLITKEDIQWVGIPRKELLIKWLSYKTDLLISLNPGHSPLMRYLCAASNCQLKASIDYGNPPEKAIDFYLQMERVENSSVKDLCAAIYEALNNIS